MRVQAPLSMSCQRSSTPAAFSLFRGLRTKTDKPSTPTPETVDTSPTTATTEEPNAKKPSRFKKLWREYGWVGLGTYFVIYIVFLGSIYYLVSHGLLKQETIDKMINYLTEKIPSIKNWLPSDQGQQAFGAHAIGAILVNDLLEPVRILLTVAATPRVARMIRNRR